MLEIVTKPMIKVVVAVINDPTIGPIAISGICTEEIIVSAIALIKEEKVLRNLLMRLIKKVRNRDLPLDITIIKNCTFIVFVLRKVKLNY